jgi:hypothetical protein
MFYPVNFSNYQDNVAAMFTCPSCGAAADIAVSWKDVVHESCTVPGAKSQFGPMEVPVPFPPFKRTIDIPLNLWAHFDAACGACGKKVTAYLDCQAGGGHGESLYCIAAVKVGEDYVVEGFKSLPPKRHYPVPPAFDPAGSTTRFLSEVWFNGAQWELAMPEAWSVRRHGAHEFSTPYGALLRLGVSLPGKIMGADHMRLPSDDMPEFEQTLYKSTKSQADNFESPDTVVERYVLGELTGYAYRILLEDGRFRWCGFFGSGVFGMYVNLTAPPQNETYCVAATHAMLASVRFHAKAVGEPTLPDVRHTPPAAPDAGLKS